LASLSYRLLTGHEPFSGADPFAILHEVISGTQQLPSQRVPWLGEGVDRVLQRGMSKRPADRYPDILAFADALGAAVELLPAGGGPFPRPLSERVSDGFVPPAQLAERDTLEFVRIKKPATVRRRSKVVRVALLAVALVWLFPSTRTIARATWGRATVQARRVLVALSTQ
jgi:hypothetical protein